VTGQAGLLMFRPQSDDDSLDCSRLRHLFHRARSTSRYNATASRISAGQGASSLTAMTRAGLELRKRGEI
jgi:hypothetical protein